jgi:RHS repeat-associated protein
VTLGKTFYYYDGEGRRVGKVSGAVTQIFVYDARGRLAAEYGGQTEMSGTHYITSDHLGTTRVITDASKAVLMCKDYLPFGDELPATAQNERSSIACYSGETGLRQKFTGKERDSESRLDYFGARYYSWAQGRFTSPDAPLLDQSPEQPQSWNLYTYARNNPLANVDRDGNLVATVTGTIAGGAIGGTVEFLRGGSFFRGAATGALAGAISGSVIDTGGASLGVLALAGAAGGIGGGVMDRALNGQTTTLGDVGMDATVGAAAGVVGGKAGEAVVNSVAQRFLSSVATKAAGTVGPGSGALHGVKVHAEFANRIQSSFAGKLLNLHSEVSYSGRELVRYGAKGSVRPDVVRGSPGRPGAIFDLKTGKSRVTPRRTQRIQQNLPHKAPVRQIKPDED